jgi:hypothetical protein
MIRIITTEEAEHIQEAIHSVDVEICEECNNEINCKNNNIYILTNAEKGEEKLWCQSCFEEHWKEYSNNGWTGDDIEYYLDLEKEEQEEIT